MLLISSIRAWSIEWSFLKPNYLWKRRLLSLYIIFSKISEKQESTEIGWQFVSSSFLPILKIDVTFAISIFSGKMLRFIDSLKIDLWIHWKSLAVVFYEFIDRCDNIYIYTIMTRRFISFERFKCLFKFIFA